MCERPSLTLIEAELDEDWRLGVRFGLQRGCAIVTEVRVFPPRGTSEHDEFASGERSWDGPIAVADGGLTTTHLRAIRFGPLMEALRPFLEDELGRGLAARETLEGAPPQGWPGLVARTQPAWVEAMREMPRHTGSAGREERHYAAVADVYATLVQFGCDAPAVAIRDAVRLADGAAPSLAVVRRWLKDARDRGYLTQDVAQGAAGGRITEAAERILKDGGWI
jgi:hypothetical protein